MAPRGRPRKVGLKRIDAAVDALRPLGFSKDVICNTVNSLLKVYEGDAGWVFIEEASYKLLIETILEEQEKDLVEKDDTSKDGTREIEITEPLAVETAREVVGIGETSAVLDKTRSITETGSRQDISWKDISCANQESSLLQVDRVGPAALCKSKLAESSEYATTYVQPLSTPTLRRRKPCYGWISDDDNDDEEEEPQIGFRVYQKAEIIQSMGELGQGRKRKNRWDVKPEVM